MPRRLTARHLIRNVAAVLILIARASPLAAETATLSPSRDNTLFENASGSTSNGSGSELFVGRTNQPAGTSLRRGLIAFDIAGQIPAGAAITAVELTLHLSRTISGPQDVSLHRVLADWGEGASVATARGGGRGGTAMQDDATWVHRFFPDGAWSTPGGDFLEAPSATSAVGSVGIYTWSGEGLVADVQAWLDGTANNFGWLLRGNETTPATAKRFDSREHATAVFRPQLFVTYAGTALESTSWNRIKRFYR
jgi:hypothetical protein